MRYIVTGRMRIWRQHFSIRYESFEEFLDSALFETPAAAESRLTVLQAYAARINNPPFPMGEEKQRLTTAANIDAAITGLTCLRVKACEIVIKPESE